VENLKSSDFRQRAILVVIFGFAMAYFESAAVVYLQRALKMTPQTIFPLRDQNSLGGLGGIEIGRETATLVMLAAVGWITGRRGLHIAWCYSNHLCVADICCRNLFGASRGRTVV
jgi:hypothetical protein